MRDFAGELLEDRISRRAFIRKASAAGFSLAAAESAANALAPLVSSAPQRAVVPPLVGTGGELLAEQLRAFGTRFVFVCNSSGMGALCGSLTIAYLGSIRRKGAWLLTAATVFGLLLCLFATARTLPVAMLLLALAGAAQAVYMSLNNTLLQMIVPDHLRGRVLSLYMLDRGFMPLGAMFAGTSAHFIGAPLTVAIMGAIVIVLALLVAWAIPAIRKLET